jgi:hypothetical protein
VEETGVQRLAASLSAIVAAVAIWAAFAVRNDFSWWHEDAWMRIPLATGLVAMASGVTTWISNRWVQWLIRAIAVGCASLLIFPQGEAWEFLQADRTAWLTILCVSCLAAWIGATHRSEMMSGLLALGWIPILAASAFLTSQSFLKVTEPLLAISSVLGWFGIAALWPKFPRLMPAVAGPCLFAASACIASSQFNSFLGLPNLLIWYTLATPAIAAILTWLPRGLHKPEHAKFVSRMITVLVICCALAISIAVWTAWLTSGGGEEDW